MGKKRTKIKLRHRVLIKGTVEEFALLGDFLFSFDFGIVGFKGFKELASGQERTNDLVIEVVPEIDNRKNERLPGWYRVYRESARVVLNGATDEQLAKFADALRKKWFPTEEERAEELRKQHRASLDSVMNVFPEALLRAQLARHIRVDAAPLKTD